MHRTIWMAVLGLGLMSRAALAMGYDSLACPELSERRIAYFTQNGFCDPAKSAEDQKDCKAITPGAEDQLPQSDRTQVQMIIRTQSRKSCPDR